MNIVGTFNSENDIYLVYPKPRCFEVKEIFNEYWDDFLVYADKHNINIRDAVLNNV